MDNKSLILQIRNDPIYEIMRIFFVFQQQSRNSRKKNLIHPALGKYIGRSRNANSFLIRSTRPSSLFFTPSFREFEGISYFEY